ncbi:MAG: 50S ribosomal protein L1 [Candidatus Woesearchaeota archaeon]
MEKQDIIVVLQKLVADSKKRNFIQSIDLTINLKNLNLKKPEEQIDLFQTLPFTVGKKRTVCAIVGPELYEDAKKVCDFVIHSDDLDKYKENVRNAKNLARKYDFFIAQANLMTKVAAVFGKTLGPKGKMPNPKIGAVVPPKTNLTALVDKFQKTVRLLAKTSPLVHVMVGRENQPLDEVAENIRQIYENLIHHLPKERHNIKSVQVKLTMGKPYKLAI